MAPTLLPQEAGMNKAKSIAITIISFASLLTIAPVSATSKVSFEGGAEDFVFTTSGETWTESDLFDNLKNAMPGDQITEEILVENYSNDYDTVKIYLRADPHDDETNPLSPAVAETETVATMSDFLAQLTMKVYNGSTLIYESSPDDPATLSDYVLLGDFKRGEATTLKIDLFVPTDLGNTYAHRAGEIDWIFLAENSTTPSAANTGFFTTVSSYLAPSLLTLLIVAVVFGIIKHRKMNPVKK